MSTSNALRELPDGWAQCSIGAVTLPTTKINPKVEKDREVKYIDISSIDNIGNVVGNVKRVKLRHAPSRARQVVHSGDTLFSTVRPYLRNIALVPSCYDQEIASTGFSVLRPAEGISPGFLFYKTISNDFVDSVSGMQYGVSYPAVKDEQIRDQRLWLPPTAEQYRIVAKIDEFFLSLSKASRACRKPVFDWIHTAKPYSSTPSRAGSRDNGAKRTKTSWRRLVNFSTVSTGPGPDAMRTNLSTGVWRLTSGRKARDSTRGPRGRRCRGPFPRCSGRKRSDFPRYLPGGRIFVWGF